MASSLFNNGFKFAPQPPDLASVMAAVATLQEFRKYLLDLNIAQTRSLFKMGPGAFHFVTEAYNLARANPQLKPGFVDLDAFQQDLEAYEALRTITQGLSQPHDMANDTLLFIGARNYASARNCYKGFQDAAAMNLPGAALLVEILAPQFAGQGKSSTSPVTGDS